MVVLICISVMISDVEHSDLLPIFQLGCWLFLLLSCISCLYILEIEPLSVASFETIFSHSINCLFVFFLVSFAVQKLETLILSEISQKEKDRYHMISLMTGI